MHMHMAGGASVHTYVFVRVCESIFMIHILILHACVCDHAHVGWGWGEPRLTCQVGSSDSGKISLLPPCQPLHIQLLLCD